MLPSSPLPHDGTPPPLCRSPSSLANVSYATRRRRGRLIPATSDDELLPNSEDDEDEEGGSGRSGDYGAGRSGPQLSSSSLSGGVTMPVGLANWRRVPKVVSQSRSRSGSASAQQGGRGIMASAASVDGNGTSRHAKSGRKEGSSGSFMGRARKQGLGMGMKGTPAKRGWSKSKSTSKGHSKSKSRSIGIHSTPIEEVRHRSRSGSQASHLGTAISRYGSHSRSKSTSKGATQQGIVTGEFSPSSSLSTLPSIHSSTDDDSDLPSVPSELGSIDTSIPTIPARAAHTVRSGHFLSLKNVRETDDVFSATYAMVRRNLPPPGLPRDGLYGVSVEEEYDRLVAMAEEMEDQQQSLPSEVEGSEEADLGSGYGKGDRADAIRQKMFPGMVDMLWPVVSSSDLPSSQRDSMATDPNQSAAGGREDRYMDYEVPVKGTPYRSGVASRTGSDTATARPKDARIVKAVTMTGPASASGSGTSVTPVLHRLLKSAMKHSELVSPIGPSPPLRSALRITPDIVRHRFLPDDEEHSRQHHGESEEEDEDTEVEGEDYGNRDDEEAEITEDSTGVVQTMFSFDQPLRGDTLDETPRSYIETAEQHTMPRPRRPNIRDRPKTPAARGSRTDRHKITLASEESIDATPSIPLHRTRKPAMLVTRPRSRVAESSSWTRRITQAGDRTVVLRKPSVLERSLSQLLASEDEDDPVAKYGTPNMKVARLSAAESAQLANDTSRPTQFAIEPGRGDHRPQQGIRIAGKTMQVTGTAEGLSTARKRTSFFDMTLSQLLKTSSEAGDDHASQAASIETSRQALPPTHVPTHQAQDPSAADLATLGDRIPNQIKMPGRSVLRKYASERDQERPHTMYDRVKHTAINVSPRVEMSRSARRPLDCNTIEATKAVSGNYDDMGDFDESLIDDGDEYEPFLDAPDGLGFNDAEESGRRAVAGDLRRSMRRSSEEEDLPPCPWTPSSHRGSPCPEPLGWYHNRSSSPLTFSRSVSPFERLITPPIAPIEPSGLIEPKRASKNNKKNRRKMKLKGAWKGQEVLLRMEEADQGQAEFWLWVQGERVEEDNAGQGRKAQKRQRKTVASSEEEEALSDVNKAGRRGMAGTRRKKARREDVLHALYGTSQARAAMEARLAHYDELDVGYDLAVETVW